MSGNTAVDVLLGLAVAGELVCVAGVLVMRTTFDRLHYAAAASTVPLAFLLAAVLCLIVFAISLLWVREVPLKRGVEVEPVYGDEASPQPAAVRK